MIVREIGRGVHGKVKLAEDIESHDLVVCIIMTSDQVNGIMTNRVGIIGYQDCG